ncbi:serine/threonine-protein kinase PLK1 [Lepeophtheirus salmonis]|uniref:Pololike kinase 1 [Gallus gallus] n=1 Tax=Lepeophtheirus salmonis TaxID=72036 RepID=A0A0K2T7L5_LEPSM|nr:serine/threonine-protein kinase PLK1-like [Lepeophtheirus salmonis]XP_040578879.1 serine/threonine-protein kinase PLK1-like [Lepeophtheirus salmonis]XP_040578880.1 serine/threonine-protein kinase PLK1-like [Lepeophtheirus salmonis]
MTKVRREESPPPQIMDPSRNVPYQRGPLLGKGGFAKVYEVREPHGKVYADKMIRRDFLELKQGSKAKVEREIRLHKELKHQNIVRFIHTFQDSLYCHILLEKCNLKSLFHLVRFRKALTETEVRYYVKQICDGVRYIHSKEILHRDLKLGNMFLTREYTVKIGDFGLAIKMDSSSLRDYGKSKFSLCGTPNYIAPEVLAKLGHHMAADIWAVGCMTYAMLFGSPPFETKSLSRTYAKIASNNYTIPKKSISLHTHSFIKKLLDPHPELRGQLHQPGQNQDLLQEPFFKKGFLPCTLPNSAMACPPKFSVEALQGKDYFHQNTHTEDAIPPGCVPGNLKLKIASIFQQSVTSSNSSANSSSSSLNSPTILTSSSAILSETVDNLRQCVRSSFMGKDLEFPSPVEFIPVFVTKWIDYSNKHGFGYRLSDGAVGAFLNDNTHISYCEEEEKRLYEYSDVERSFTFNMDGVRSVTPDLLSRVHLLDYLSRYMAKKLACANPSAFATQVTVTTRSTTTIPHIVKWWRTPRFLVMILNNTSIQINFIQEHTKIVLWKCNNEFFASFFASKSLPITFNLESLSTKAAFIHTDIGELLQQVLHVLEDLNRRNELEINESTTST